MPIRTHTPLRLAALSWMLLTLGAAGLSAQQPASPAAPDSIHKLMEQDQADRQGITNATAERWKEVGARDSIRRVLAQQLLAAGLVHSSQDYEDASLIFQHGGTPQEYLEAHVLAMAALAKGDTGAAWIAAATLDRYLQSIKQPQIFGTQYSWAKLKPRAEGATQEPYDRDVVSDALRRAFCVTSQDGQRRNLEAMERHQSWPSPDGCR